MEQTINTATLLPVGERLKPLLNKASISESDMKSILSNRGVYIGDSNKKMSIPLLTLSLLSPKEFEKLQELQKTKEDCLKAKVSNIKSMSSNNLNDVIPMDLIKRESLIGDTDNFDIDTDLDFTMNNPNKLVLEYEIVREDVTKDWASCRSKYAGRVEVTKDKSNSTIYFNNEYTSTETEKINRKIIKSISDHCLSQGEISNTEKSFEITSDKFNNKQRFSFMLRLNNDSPNGFLKFQAVKNIEIGPDKSFTMPDNAKWMEGCVKNIIINSEKGETLQNVEYISDVNYHDFLILRQIQAQYEFSMGATKGTCIIEYGFPHYFRSHAKSKIFEVSVPKIYFASDSKSISVKPASRAILNEFSEMFQMEYESVINA